MYALHSLTEIEHVLKRPGMYIGSSFGSTEVREWLYNEKVECCTWECNGIIRKCIDEVVSNAIDNAIGNDSATLIQIDVTDTSFSCLNDGVHMLCNDLTSSGVNSLEAAFGTLRTSSRFNESQTTIGTNGIGVKLTNIFSSAFNVQLVDENGDEKGVQWTNNMRNLSECTVDCEVLPGSIRVFSQPDALSTGNFGSLLSYIPWLKHRCLEASTCHANIEFVINSVTIKDVCIADFIKMHSSETQNEPVCIANGVYAMFHSEPVTDSDCTFSMVNGHRTIDHGIHVDYVLRLMLQAIPGNKKVSFAVLHRFVKEHLVLFMNFNVSGAVFNSQAKHRLVGGTISQPTIIKSNEVRQFFDELLERLQMESILKQKHTRKQYIKIEKLHDAIRAGSKDALDCTLILTEGDSAKTFAMSGLAITGHDLFGVFPLRGKALNVCDETDARIMSNQEWKNVMQILGLTIGSYRKASLRYGKVLILADADLDGVHIAGLIINFFVTLFPQLIHDIPTFLQMLRTPVVKTHNGKKTQEFFSMHEYRAATIHPTARISYYKGLGSSTRDEARNYFSRLNELQRGVVHATSDDTQSMQHMFTKKHIEKRKQLIIQHLQAPVVLKMSNTISTRDFVRSELLYFSAYDVQRSIPSIIDGLKISQRKVVFVARSMKNMKVAQLASTVALKTMYLHGESSLADCIIGMAQDFVGSNNVALLHGTGQFGSRLLGGKDSASPRYTHAQQSTFMRHTFLDVDDNLLDYLEEENVAIEPKFFVPIIPIILLNGARGIATGYSSYIPNHRLSDILKAIMQILDGEDPDDIQPYFEKFKGTITRTSDSRYSTSGIYSHTKKGYEISELPLYTWTEPFLQKLQNMKEIAKVVSRCDDVSVNIDVKTESSIEKLMTNTISTSNMYLLNENSELQKFGSATDILKYFVDFRLKYYTKRKAWILQKLHSDAEGLRLFIKLIKVIKLKGISAYMQNPHAFFDEHNLPHKLMNTAVSELTDANLKKQEAKLTDLNSKIDEQEKQTEKEMYITDLSKLKS